VTAQESALAHLTTALDRLGVPHMIIGGLAAALWGEPRATVDIDVTVWVEEADIPKTIASLAKDLTPLTADPAAFIRDTRVLPLRGQGGVRIDMIFGMLPFEEGAIRRAVRKKIAGVEVPVCTAEDLILHKIISDRARDLEDVEGILRRRFGVLDLPYVEPRIAELAALLDRPEIRSRWSAWKSRFGRDAPP
jgi:hypothetical protein